MNYRNVSSLILRSDSAARLELGPRSFGVLTVPARFRVQCLRGWVWITQERNTSDTVLARGDGKEMAGGQRVFLTAFEGAMLAISDACVSTESTGRPVPALEFQLEITRGRYSLSGGVEGRGSIYSLPSPVSKAMCPALPASSHEQSA